MKITRQFRLSLPICDKSKAFCAVIAISLFSPLAYGQVQVGNGATAGPLLSVAIGDNAEANGAGNTALGNNAEATGAFNASALGKDSKATARSSTAIGAEAEANSEFSSSFGYWSIANGFRSTSLGYLSRANAADCVALGSFSQCNEANTVSVGSGVQGTNGVVMFRRITNLAWGVQNSDAATMGQLRDVTGAIGGGSYVDNTGQFIPPQINLTSGYTYYDLTSAIYDIDGRLFDLVNNQVGGGGVGPVGPEGPAGPSGSANLVAGKNIEVANNSDGTTSVSLSDNVELSSQGRLAIDGGPSMSGTGIDAARRRVTGVADGRIEQGSMDAINGGQLWDMESRWNDRWEDTKNRIAKQDKRINGLGAQAMAMSQMAMSSQYLPVGKVSVNMAVGFYAQEAAVAIGWTAQVTERFRINGGITGGSGGSKVGGGFGGSYVFD